MIANGIVPTIRRWIIRLYLFFRQVVIDSNSNSNSNSIRTVLKCDRNAKIIHKSKDFLVVYKDYDVFTNNDVDAKPSVHSTVAKLFPELRDKRLQHSFYFPHRLDYATSGLLCLALNKKACAAASCCFQNGTATKFYLALLRGHLSRNFIDVRLPIGADSSERACHKMCTRQNKHCVLARDARTCILVLQRGVFSNYSATKVLIQPMSGRRHQIRVHCSFLGHTIVGDYTYSNRKDTGAERTYLHSYRLRLPNSVEPLDFCTDDPFDDAELGPSWNCVEIVNPLNRETLSKLTRAKDNCDVYQYLS